MNTQDKVDALLRTKSNPDEQLNLLKEVVVRQALEYEILLAQTGGGLGTKRKSSSMARAPTSSSKRRKMEDEAPVIHAPDDEEPSSDIGRSSTGQTGSLQGVENMTKFHDNFQREKQRGVGGKLPKPGQIDRAEEEVLEKKMQREGGDYEHYGVETTRISPSKTNVPRGSGSDGGNRSQTSHHLDTHKKSRRSGSKSREEDEEPAETISVFGTDVDREVLENTPVLDPGSNKLNTGFRLVEKVAGEGGKDIVASIGSKGGRHSHDNDNSSK